MHKESPVSGVIEQPAEPPPGAVVALAGARDYYQLPLALHEGGMLQALVTDMYCPADAKLFSLGSLLPKELIAARSCPGLRGAEIRVPPLALCASALMLALRSTRLNRYKDKVLGAEARRMAVCGNSPLFSYSYYASEAFKPSGPGVEHRFLFQLHPHPASVRSLLLEEADRAPQAKSSLLVEHEMSLAGKEFEQLVGEAHAANGWLVASSFTASTLADHGIPRDEIHVVPYGVDHDVFSKRVRTPVGEPFTIIFVGSLVQRKGLSYLLEAIRLLRSREVRVVLCGRGHLDVHLIAQYSDLNLEVNIGLNRDALVRKIHEADVFVLPSLAEGFAHVILEAMSCGVPVIATPHTCAPDVITEGVQGFVVPIRDAEAIAEKLSWGVDNRAGLAAMGEAAAEQARLFTWERFRAGVRGAYTEMLISAR